MKRFLIGLLLGIFMTAGIATAAQQEIKLIVNGKEISSDVPPQVISGRTLVPARALAEALGATVSWDAANNSIIVTSQVQVGGTPGVKNETTTFKSNDLPSLGMINLRTDKNIIHDAQKEVIIDGEIYVTVPTLFTALENSNNKIVEPVKNTPEEIVIGQTTIRYIGREKDIDGHRYIPISLFEKNGVLKYSWDNNTKTLKITTR